MLRILTLVVILLLPLCSLSSLSEAKVTGEEIYNKTLESTQIYNDTQLQEYIRNLGLEIDCKIGVIRSGEIIPRIVGRYN